MKTPHSAIVNIPAEEWPDDVIQDQAEKIIGIMGRTRPAGEGSYINRVIREATQRGLLPDTYPIHEAEKRGLHTPEPHQPHESAESL